MFEGWDQIAYTNGDKQHGLTGVVHHKDGCKGRRDSEHSAGWHVQTGTKEELEDSPIMCETCRKMGCK